MSPSRPTRKMTAGKNASSELYAICCASPIASSARNSLNERLSDVEPLARGEAVRPGRDGAGLGPPVSRGRQCGTGRCAPRSFPRGRGARAGASSRRSRPARKKPGAERRAGGDRELRLQLALHVRRLADRRRAGRRPTRRAAARSASMSRRIASACALRRPGHRSSAPRRSCFASSIACSGTGGVPARIRPRPTNASDAGDEQQERG